MKTTCLCSTCNAWTSLPETASHGWKCIVCGDEHPLAHAATSAIPPCRCCGCADLYIQKDFPQWLGMGILVLACILSTVCYAMHWIVLTWGILIGSALLDGVLYLVMGEVIICYRCSAQNRGPSLGGVHPFELEIAERYRQERIRQAEMESRDRAVGRE
jgi:hypothetical protein